MEPIAPEHPFDPQLPATSIQILSDLHLEIPKSYDLFEIIPSSHYLALLGDIGAMVKHKDDFLAFLTQQLKQFKAVLFVPGNHEAFGSSWAKTLSQLRDFEAQACQDDSLGDFILLNRAVFRPPGTKTAILGCSLFSAVPPERVQSVWQRLNDFYDIEGWTVEDHNEAHRQHLEWLNATVAELQREGEVENVLVFTHWSPSADARAVNPRHKDSVISSAFSTDLSGEACFRSPLVKTWAFGHTHYNCDFEVSRGDGAGDVRLVTNQRGYYFSQSAMFDPRKTLELCR